ncbi:MAG: 3-phosphoserine/phosphohydroxythreonine transaminase [Gemmataceae bacterium]
MENRVYNFSAGPATLPLPVLQEAQRDLLALPGVGASVMEISHRSPTSVKIFEETEQNIRTLLQLPDNFRVLFLQGGARLHFVLVPYNFLQGQEKPASYIVTGSWGKKAIADAKKFGNVHVAFNGEADKYMRVPEDDGINVDPNSVYAHFTSNETIQGVQFAKEPDVGDVPLVCDASSDIFSRPLDLKRYGVIYGGAQKNAGPAGVTLVIIRDDMLARLENAGFPDMFNYNKHAEAQSMQNTPPVFAVYIVKLVTNWLIKEIGGLAEMDKINTEKAKLLYDVIDQSNGFYKGCAYPESRSKMNVTFTLANPELESAFLTQAKERNLTDLKGHRSVGGFRASIYNAMPREGVVALCGFMAEFAEKN